MTATATDRLRAMLDERGVDWVASGTDTCWTSADGYPMRAWDTTNGTHMRVADLTPEQAITATLGSEREAKLQKALNKAAGNWAMADAELRKALDFMRIWISEDAHLGESAISRELEKAEGLRNLDAIEIAIAATLGGGKLTADDVRNLIEHHSDEAGGNRRDFHNGAYEAIADELNATFGGGECTPHGKWESISQSQEVRHVFCDCGYELGVDERDSFPFKSTRLFAMPNYCQECGRKIRKAVKR